HADRGGGGRGVGQGLDGVEERIGPREAQHRGVGDFPGGGVDGHLAVRRTGGDLDRGGGGLVGAVGGGGVFQQLDGDGVGAVGIGHVIVGRRPVDDHADGGDVRGGASDIGDRVAERVGAAEAVLRRVGDLPGGGVDRPDAAVGGERDHVDRAGVEL